MYLENEINVESLMNIGVVVLIFVFGLLVLLTLFFIANRKTLNKKSKNYINNSKVEKPNIVDVDYVLPEQKVEPKIVNPTPIVDKPTEQEFLTNLYRKKYNNEISESEFNAAISRYRQTKDDFNE